MKCPKCKNPRIAYNVSRKRLWKGRSEYGTKQEPRVDFSAKCNKCGWEGEIHPYPQLDPKEEEKEE